MREENEYFIEVIGYNEETNEEVQYFVDGCSDDWLTTDYDRADIYTTYGDAEGIVNVYTGFFIQELEAEDLTLKECRIYKRSIQLVEVIK